MYDSNVIWNFSINGLSKNKIHCNQVYLFKNIAVGCFYKVYCFLGSKDVGGNSKMQIVY